MAKKSKRGRKRKEPPKKTKATPSPLTKAIRAIVSPNGLFVCAISLVLAGLPFYYQFKAKIDVEPDNPVRGDAAVKYPFRVTNRSVLPIYKVTPTWKLRKLIDERHNDFSGGGFENDKKWLIDRLASGESTTIEPIPVAGRIAEADVEITISYNTALLSFRKTESFRFATRREENGNLRWYHKALAEP